MNYQNSCKWVHHLFSYLISISIHQVNKNRSGANVLEFLTFLVIQFKPVHIDEDFDKVDDFLYVFNFQRMHQNQRVECLLINQLYFSYIFLNVTSFIYASQLH